MDSLLTIQKVNDAVTMRKNFRLDWTDEEINYHTKEVKLIEWLTDKQNATDKNFSNTLIITAASNNLNAKMIKIVYSLIVESNLNYKVKKFFEFKLTEYNNASLAELIFCYVKTRNYMLFNRDPKSYDHGTLSCCEGKVKNNADIERDFILEKINEKLVKNNFPVFSFSTIAPLANIYFPYFLTLNDRDAFAYCVLWPKIKKMNIKNRVPFRKVVNEIILVFYELGGDSDLTLKLFIEEKAD